MGFLIVSVTREVWRRVVSKPEYITAVRRESSEHGSDVTRTLGRCDRDDDDDEFRDVTVTTVSSDRPCLIHV
jgi:hypothetical protein